MSFINFRVCGLAVSSVFLISGRNYFFSYYNRSWCISKGRPPKWPEKQICRFASFYDHYLNHGSLPFAKKNLFKMTCPKAIIFLSLSTSLSWLRPPPKGTLGTDEMVENSVVLFWKTTSTPNSEFSEDCACLWSESFQWFSHPLFYTKQQFL